MKIMPKYKKPIVMLAMRLWKYLTKNVPVDIEYRKAERLKMIKEARMRKPIEQRIKERGFILYQTVDTGFWNQAGEYVEDVQEVDFSKEQGAENIDVNKERA